MNTSNSAIRKSLLTSCPRIGLSRRWRSNSFKSPLMERKVALNHDSPVVKDRNETPTSSHQSTPVTAETKRKNEAQDESNSKRAKRETKPKRRLIDDDGSNDEAEKGNVLNVSGCDLLTFDEKNVLTESKESNKQNDDKSHGIRELYVSVEKLSSDQNSMKTTELNLKENAKRNGNKAVEVGIKNEKLKRKKDKRNERSQESTKVTKKSPKKEVKTSHKKEKNMKDKEFEETEEIKKNKTIPKESENRDVSSRRIKETNDNENKFETKESDQIKKSESKKDMNFSPKTIVSQLETKPLLDTLDNSFMIKEKAVNKQTSKSKSSIDEYIKRKEKRKSSLGSSSSKLSMKRSSANSDSLESDEELLKMPSVQKSNAQTKKVDKSDVIDKILQLERAIADKEGQLERYKQAEVYHKIHDVKKLEGLTETWKNGCQNALQDLLLKLKEHANIDMPGLLNRLGAPVGLISYDVENGVFT